MLVTLAFAVIWTLGHAAEVDVSAIGEAGAVTSDSSFAGKGSAVVLLILWRPHLCPACWASVTCTRAAPLCPLHLGCHCSVDS